MRGGRGSSAASEHDEAESQVLFLGGSRVVEAGTLGTLALGPWLEAVEVGLLEVKRRGCCGWGVESFKSHLRDLKD